MKVLCTLMPSSRQSFENLLATSIRMAHGILHSEGIVATGLTDFYVQFFNGLIIILALLGHRWNQKRYR